MLVMLSVVPVVIVSSCSTWCRDVALEVLVAVASVAPSAVLSPSVLVPHVVVYLQFL